VEQQTENTMRHLNQDTSARVQQLQHLVLAGVLRPPLFTQAVSTQAQLVTSALVDGLWNLGHVVVDVQGLHNPRLMRRARTECLKLRRRRIAHGVRYLFHSTTRDAADHIQRTGFKRPEAVGAFGRGVYLSNTLEQATMYHVWGDVVTLVCGVLLGRAHENESVEDPDDPTGNTRPVHISPKPGYHSMHFARKIFVVHRSSWVVPLVRVDWVVKGARARAL
jgi:hypothetical protein